MKNETECGMQLLELPEAGMSSAEQICRAGSCALDATITLEDRAFCLNHFLLRCYESWRSLRRGAAGTSLGTTKRLPCGRLSKSARKKRSESA